ACAWSASGTGRTPTVCGGDHAAHPLPAAVVEPQRPGDGRRTARAPAVPPLCRPGRCRAAARREHHPALSAPAGEAPAGPQMLATINAGLAQQGLMLKTGTVVDATIIAAPSSTKNAGGERDPEMHQTKKGNQW